MGCQGFQSQFSAYLDGTLSGSRRGALDRHLRTCASCQADLRSLSRTVSILRALETEEPPAAAREMLLQKIRSVRQPMGWAETLRLEWNAGRVKAQTRAWAFGMAVSALLFLGGTAAVQNWHAPSVPLDISPFSTRQTPPPDRARPVVRAPGHALAIRKFVEAPLVVGQPTTLYLLLVPTRSLGEVDVFLSPAPGITIGGNVVLQPDASYLLRRGPVARETWLPVEIRPTSDGDCTLRLFARGNGRLVADDRITLHVIAR